MCPKEVELSLGIRRLVNLLNRNGFETTDSGDGSNYEAGMECALPCPNVYVTVEPKDLAVEADRLRALLEHEGVDFSDEYEGMPTIEALYSPVDGHAGIIVLNVSDTLVWGRQDSVNQPRCPNCGGDLGGTAMGRLEEHVGGCPRFPL